MFQPYIFVYEKQLLSLVNSQWIKDVTMVGDKICLVLSKEHKFHNHENFKKIDDFEALVYTISLDVAIAYSEGRYSEMYTEKEIKGWIAWLKKDYYVSEENLLISQILMREEKLIEVLETDLVLPRGILRQNELYEITNYWLARR